MYVYNAGTLEVSEGNLPRAMQLFEEAARWCRSEQELTHLLSLQEAARAQLAVAATLQLKLPRPSEIAAFQQAAAAMSPGAAGGPFGAGLPF